MDRYKLIGLTEYAKNHLAASDLENISQMIGCEVFESDEISDIDGDKLFIMSDNELTHAKFLQLEKITKP